VRLYGKCGCSDPCYDKRHCNPWRGSRTREHRRALRFERLANGEARVARRQKPVK
jgi:hypothetical protein